MSRSIRLSLAAAMAVLSVMVIPAMAAASAPGETGSATEVSQSTATLHATINSGGHEVFYGFEYGITAGAGENGTIGKTIPGSSEPIAVSAGITGLKPSTTYYFRIITAIEHKLVYGEYSSFRTLDPRVPRFEGGPSVSASQTGKYAFTVFESPGAGRVACETANFTASLPSSNSTLPVNASYGGCKEVKLTGVSSTVKMNSCHYVINVANAGPPYTGSTGIWCSKPGDKIEISFPELGCTVQVAAQEPGGTNKYTNEGSGSGRTVKTTIAAGSVAYKTTEGPVCFLLGSGSNGSFGGEISLSGGSAGVKIGGEFAEQVGVFMAGEKSEVEGSRPALAAERYPQVLLSEDDLNTPITVFSVGGPGETITCGSSSWTNTLSKATRSLSIEPTFSGCESSGVPMTVSMSGCKYVLNVSNAGPPYVGTPEISCPEATAMSIASEACTFVIPSQALAGEVKYTNKGTGSNRHVDVDVSAEKVNYTKTGPICWVFGGSGKDGSFSFGFRLYGLK